MGPETRKNYLEQPLDARGRCVYLGDLVEEADPPPGRAARWGDVIKVAPSPAMPNCITVNGPTVSWTTAAFAWVVVGRAGPIASNKIAKEKVAGFIEKVRKKP